MSRQLSIINGSNIFSVNLLKHIRGFDKIKIGDIFNSRNNVRQILYLYYHYLIVLITISSSKSRK